MPYKVELCYYKTSGKYYAHGEYVSDKEAIHAIFTEAVELVRSGKGPGLVEGASKQFYAAVTVPDHPHEHPFLIVPFV